MTAAIRLTWLAVPLLLAACATAPTAPPASPVAAAPVAAPPAAPRELPLPEAFEGDGLVVAFARAGDTAETLAARYLGDAAKAWLIADYTGKYQFAAGEEVLFPTRPWNPTGVVPEGYQIVPILVYHNLGPQAAGRLVLAARAFEEQMRYLKAQGYRVVSLADFVESLQGRRQLPRKSVVLSFDDGYRAFKDFAYPVLKELGFTATLFVYTDYVGAGRNALSWPELKQLAAEGFEVHAHSKTHADLRRARGETDAQFGKRMQDELFAPQRIFERQLGRAARLLAYPYGRTDDDVIRQTREAGYIAAFTVRRQASPSFVERLRVHRSQIYSEMTLEEFARNLDVWHAEDLR
jgi:peptidoglycan/xylan/chitin deacetylase (PgdA/CDA1 family)